jgi:outer membrane receptor protein involved in Fe transport
MTIKAFVLLSASSGALAFAAPAVAQDTGSPAAAAAGAGVEASNDIVVTASKREEKLRDVPSTITAIGSREIETLGIKDFHDYATLVPGLSQRDLGSPGVGTIVLRGLYTGPQQSTNTTSFYLDDAPLSASGFLSFGAQVTPSPDFADVERIEVLKGPQGTLYGASSLGGLVRVITKKPDANAFSGSLQIEGSSVSGGDQGGLMRGVINLPLITDKLAVRAVGFYRRSPGWTDNVTTGETNVNTARIKGGRIALRATPTEHLTIDLSGLYQDIDSDGLAFQDNVQNTTRPLYGVNKFAAVAGTGAARLRYREVSGSATQETGIGSIVATASYFEGKTRRLLDYTPIFSPLLPIPGLGQVIADFGPNLKKTTLEARFVSKRLGPIEFVAGGFYTHEKSAYPFLISANEADGKPLPSPYDVVLRSNTLATYDEYAGYGNLTFYITDQLDVTGGLRYAHNKQDGASPPGIAFYAPTPGGTTSFSDSKLTYLATIRYRPTQAISFYARAASGYRPGGPQNTTTLPPGAQSQIHADTVWNYEGGVKASLLNGALNANVALYHIDWKDIQLSTIYLGRTMQGNAGAAEVDGWEVELEAHPSRDLAISGNVGHTYARITDISAQAQASLGAKPGNRLPLTPDYSAAVSVDQRLHFSDSVGGSLGATLRFTSDMPSSYPGYALNPNVKIPSVATMDVRASINLTPVTLQFRLENLFNERGFTSMATNLVYVGQSLPTTGTVIRPRTAVLSATVDF